MLHQTRRAVLGASILASVILTGWVGLSLARFVTEGWWLAVLIALPLGVAAIDVLSGVVHWACDRFGDAASPVVGPLLIRAFREHHVDPRQMVEHDWVETNGEPCFFSALALALLAWLAPSVQSGLAAAAVTRFAPGRACVPSSGTPRFGVLHQHGPDEPALGSHGTLVLARTLA